MEVLLRFWNDKYYVWKPVKIVDNRYYVETEGTEVQIAHSSIMAIKDDTRIGHVECAYCGKLIKDDPESIEQHFAEEEAKRDCLTCKFLTTYGDKNNRKVTYTQNDDGTYHVTEVCDTHLGCRQSYFTKNINSDSAKASCIYNLHRSYGTRKIDDIFVTYPNPFERQITVDVLNEKKYPYVHTSNGYFEYDLKCRGTLRACVNQLGVVDHLKVTLRGWTYIVYYSDKYNKLFFVDRNKYNENCKEIMSDAKIKQILDKISALYKEAKANDEE